MRTYPIDLCAAICLATDRRGRRPLREPTNNDLVRTYRGFPLRGSSRAAGDEVDTWQKYPSAPNTSSVRLCLLRCSRKRGRTPQGEGLVAHLWRGYTPRGEGLHMPTYGAPRSHPTHTLSKGFGRGCDPFCQKGSPATPRLYPPVYSTIPSYTPRAKSCGWPFINAASRAFVINPSSTSTAGICVRFST